ncbi:uncharacterized protein BCR38DRAFT_354325 [Pseudomassariella vexata]|uniref:Chitin-binding type-4 domain-containing protein n=1 Tax=Pseudomassariella vexata TaxID=1141098 RepID=A0A1Y2DDT7_9PEZI|nr:uncharacterized protein BCR38DRAFT_354325 [Pseudomassariella vexata]ORY57428.1 hypothetical protein BCR38DRAFT_354325 [Pseudomassariella vexata]
MGQYRVFSAVVAAALALSSTSNAHMIMKTPAPFGNPDNSPLSSSGANFPCKVTGDAATFYSGVDATEMAVGTDQTLSFTGSAVHGGGSCQLAITSDKQPSASSTWQVIQSIEGGCPTKDGTNPGEYTYQIPEGVAAGDYVFAWTWISKLAGQPEYYMNCAPIKVTGGSAKRSPEETKELATRAASLPNLFVANLESVNSCKTTPGTDPTFPDPGTTVNKFLAGQAKYAEVDGTNCFPVGATGGGSGSGSGSATTTAAAAEPTSTTADAAAPTTSSATGFVTSVLPTTSPTTTAASPTTASASSAPTSSGTPSTTGGLTGECTSEGMFNCVDGSSFQQCASGTWTSLQAMPAGTTCAAGQSTTLWSREIRRIRTPRRSLPSTF